MERRADVGHIKLSRRQFDGHDDLWDDDTKFDSRSAWTWLLQAAAWKDSEYRVKLFSEPLKRGEFVASLRFLASRWKWGKTHVAKYLAHLEKRGRLVRQRSGQHGSVYLIVNYDAYQDPPSKARTPEGTESRTPRGHLADKVEAVKAVKALTTTTVAVGETKNGAHPERPAVSWVTEGVEWWRANVGHIEHGVFGAALKGPVHAHGWPSIFAALKTYVDVEKRTKHPKYFANDLVKWREFSTMGITDENGDLTALGLAMRQQRA